MAIVQLTTDYYFDKHNQPRTKYLSSVHKSKKSSVVVKAINWGNTEIGSKESELTKLNCRKLMNEEGSSLDNTRFLLELGRTPGEQSHDGAFADDGAAMTKGRRWHSEVRSRLWERKGKRTS